MMLQSVIDRYGHLRDYFGWDFAICTVATNDDPDGPDMLVRGPQCLG